MKNILKILTTLAALLAVFIFSTCKQFTDDPEEFFDYWSKEVVPRYFHMNCDHPSIGRSFCIPSGQDVRITIGLNNPKNIDLIMPTSDADAGRVICFPGLPPDQQPRYSTDYTLEEKSIYELELIYKADFLKKHEWSNGGIGPEITLISTDGRIFSRKFSLNIEVNTAPPDVGNITIAKTQVESNWYYALCFDETAGMTPMLDGKRLHKDIKAIHIQEEGGSEVIIPLTVKKNGSGFNIPPTPSEGLLSSVDRVFDVPPGPGSWIVYVKTNASPSSTDALSKKYRVWLTDEKGLSSAPKEAETLGFIPDLSDFDTAWHNLKTAVAKARPGGLITIMNDVKATNAPGNSGTIEVNKSLTIKGKNGAVFDTQLGTSVSNKPVSNFRIFTVTGDNTEFTLEDLKLKNGIEGGPSEYGGAISAVSIKTLALKNCTITNCTAYGGGGIYLNGGVEAVLERCTITGCQTMNAGGGAIFAGNSSDNQPIVRIKGGIIKDNTGHITGGAINITRGNLYINTDENGDPDTMSTTTEIKDNTLIASGGQGNLGGGINCYWDPDKPGELKIQNAKIKNCNIKYATHPADKTGRGAGISVYGKGEVSLSNVTLNQCGFIGETAADKFTIKQGGGMYLKKVQTATIKDCTIENSTTAKEGGGIYAEDSSLTIRDTKIHDNYVKGKGAGLYVLANNSKGKLTIDMDTEDTGTEFVNNNTDTSIGDGLGGGIYMKGRNPQNSVIATMSGGKFISNGAKNGGGIYIDKHANFLMNNGKLSNNTALTSSGGKGCAVYINTNGTFIWRGGTITGHTSGYVIQGTGEFLNATDPHQTEN
ncbi:right-handed parallel beta-helix repeat-containing protein [Treponema denticola]|uniref:right-handed parallel beta-helix repeat-containing protein n=1 Tax=Treponema denticola TaxID=158 RepID=UPI0020A58F72|nr:right-handed parallel beta-helix repeat-containing protein [Treponema denticola]UTC83156.1 hypothetical protein HGJ18_08040 [Treponema denticola]